MTRRSVTAAVAAGTLLLAVAFLTTSTQREPVTFASASGVEIPLPFMEQTSNLRGALTYFGQRGGIDVYETDFKDGQTDEHFEPDKIYLVHIPNSAAFGNVPVDHVMLQALTGQRIVNYYGYRYTDANATLERRDIYATRFADRFAGQFFASQSARDDDVNHGGLLHSFEEVAGITFKKTDGSPGSVLVGGASLYVFVVNEPDGALFSPRTDAGECGNAALETGEECDDGNQDDTDLCHNDCTKGLPIPFGSGSVLPDCGNGTVEGSEQCDDGNTVNTDACDTTCHAVSSSGGVCGDSHVDSGEQCDDGNTNNTDTCDNSCHTVSSSGAVCGNGSVEGTEQCDAGQQNGQICDAVIGGTCTYCSSACTNVTVHGSASDCGNGTINAGEECDDGNQDETDDCDNACHLTIVTPLDGYCGDGTVQSNEQCDDGNTNNADACDNTCHIVEPDPVLTIAMLPLPTQGSSATGNLVPLVRFNATAHNKTVALSRLVFTDADLAPINSMLTEYRLVRGPAEGDYDFSGFAHCSMNTAGSELECDIGDGMQAIPAGTVAHFQLYGAFATPQTNIQFRIAPSENDEYGFYIDGGEKTLRGMKVDGLCEEPFCLIDLRTITSTSWNIGGPQAAPVCGDKLVAFLRGEECDDGNQVNGDECSNQCRYTAGSICGNGLLTVGETCDDGDTDNNDGCSSACVIESGFTCNGASPTVCSVEQVCGDGVVGTGETCDQGGGNHASGDGCSSTCSIETNFRCVGTPSVCQSHLNFVKALADTNQNGVVSDNEALILTLDVAEAPDQPFSSVSRFDIDADGDVDNADVALILTQLDILAP